MARWASDRTAPSSTSGSLNSFCRPLGSDSAVGSIVPSLSSRAPGSGLKPSAYCSSRPVEAGPHVGHVEHQVVGQLGQADPQPQVVGGQAPLLGEAGDVGYHDVHRRAGRPGDRQVVGAERPLGQVADRAARRHRQHHRAHDLHQPAEHGGEGIAAGGRVERRRASGRRRRSASGPAARTAGGSRPAHGGPTCCG